PEAKAEADHEPEAEPLFMKIDTAVAPALMPSTPVEASVVPKVEVTEAKSPLPFVPPSASEGVEREAKRPLQQVKKKAVSNQPVSTLKVRTDDLESLITTVGGIRGIDDKDLELLQSATLQLRMVPVGELFGRFRKVVRDLSEELEKAIGIEISGESVKLDKMIADKLSEPLLHMVRNAASHGVETVEERAALGKTKAVIRLNAYQEGGQVVIEVSDNGRGMSVEKIKKRVIAMELADHEELEAATDKKILDYIFAPGFSTKEAADKVSGRGVGMDVVKNAIGALQGSVSIDTKEGVGTVIRLQLPLTLAIIRGMVLEQSGNKIAVPAGSVDRIMNMTQAELEEGSFLDKNRPSLYLAEEGEILPLVNFSTLFGLESKSTKRCVVLLKVGGGHKIALVVDAAVGRQPLTVKPLDRFSETRYFSSASFVDGEVIFILNIPSLQAA
ncbi:MAG: chemotaxis protein CheW, partial [Deltaproteobacteria bacterium]|nr:chemotaxis protein CheW [Deltaproteobacteria bacterium]